MIRPCILKWIIPVLGILILMTFPANAVAETIRIKIATLAPEGSPWTKTFDAVNMELRKKTDNQVQLKIYPGGVMGDEKDMLRKMYIGQIHGAVLTSATLSTIFPEISVFQVPFLFQTNDEVDYVLDKMDAFFRKGFNKKGFRILGWSEVGFVQLMSTTPAETLEKIKKLKVWIWEDAPMARAIFNEAGVSGIPLSIPDVLVGLQTGLVDIVYAPPSGAIALQWFTRTKYMNDVPLIYLMGGIIAKDTGLKKLSAAHQRIIKECFDRHIDGLQTMVRKQNQEATRVMIDHGVKILKVSDDQVEQFKSLSTRAMQNMRGAKFSPQTLIELKSHLERYRQEKK